MSKKLIKLIVLVIFGGSAFYFLSTTNFWHQIMGHTRGTPVRIGKPAAGRLELTEEEWKIRLPPEAFRVARQEGTERAFTGSTWDNKKPGVYQCVCCQQPLFSSTTKFDSGTGWPSFWAPIDEESLSLYEDRGLFMVRVEVLCSRCDAHLGHVFDDGPAPSGLRYCMNSAAMHFVEEK